MLYNFLIDALTFWMYEYAASFPVQVLKPQEKQSGSFWQNYLEKMVCQVYKIVRYKKECCFYYRIKLKPFPSEVYGTFIPCGAFYLLLVILIK